MAVRVLCAAISGDFNINCVDIGVKNHIVHDAVWAVGFDIKYDLIVGFIVE